MIVVNDISLARILIKARDEIGNLVESQAKPASCSPGKPASILPIILHNQKRQKMNTDIQKARLFLLHCLASLMKMQQIMDVPSDFFSDPS